jgi:arabinofuranosyltransferase
LLTYKLALTPVQAIIGILMLMASRAFIDYSTSGLENPLSHLLTIIFIIIFLNKSYRKDWLFLLMLTASLGLLNRMDLALVFFPAMLYAVWERHTKQDFLFAALGITPFILWELFSLFYYGFPFPNTAYAKLNTGIPVSLLLKQGVLYLLNSISRDPLTLSIIGTGIFISIIERNGRRIALALGIILYLVYIIRIGGDYMVGRFLSVLVCGAVALIVSSNLFAQKQSFIVAVVALALLSLATPKPPLLYNAGDSREEIGPMGIYNGIEDGRFFNYQQTGLLTLTLSEPMPKLGWAYEGQEAREREYQVVARGPVGAFGYYAGPSVHVVDWFGIGDPLLARLPVDDPLNWRIGHFYRSVPEGYLETLESDSLALRDPNLAAYYQKLMIVTRGKLFDANRLIEIWKLNTGAYQPLIEAYEASLSKSITGLLYRIMQ